MLSADTHRLSRLPARLCFNARMLLPTLLAACIFGAAAIPGIDVDSPADDRELFRKLEEQTNALAEKGDVAVGRAERLEQCRRGRTDAFRLTARAATGAAALDWAYLNKMFDLDNMAAITTHCQIRRVEPETVFRYTNVSRSSEG